MSDSAEQFAARVEMCFYNFFKAHFRADKLSSCPANKAILERYMDENLLDASKAESIEIAFLAVGHQLVRTTEPVPPEPPSPLEQVAEPEDLTEQQQLRQILRIDGHDPKTVANKMRSILKVKDAHAKAQQTTLPPTITKEDLLKDRFLLRKMIERFGSASVDDRLNGRN